MKKPTKSKKKTATEPRPRQRKATKPKSATASKRAQPKRPRAPQRPELPALPTPTTTDERIGLALFFAEQQRWDEMDAAFEDAEQQEPGHPQVAFQRAFVYQGTSLELERALAAYASALARDLDVASVEAAHLNIGLVATILGDLSLARASFATAEALPEPQYLFNTLVGQAMLALTEGAFDEAVGLAERAVTLQPNHELALLVRVSALCRSGRLDEAIARAAELREQGSTSDVLARVEGSARIASLASGESDGLSAGELAGYARALGAARAGATVIGPVELVMLLRPLELGIRPFGDLRAQVFATAAVVRQNYRALLGSESFSAGSARAFLEAATGLAMHGVLVYAPPLSALLDYGACVRLAVDLSSIARELRQIHREGDAAIAEGLAETLKTIEGLKHDAYWVLREVGAAHLPALAAAIHHLEPTSQSFVLHALEAFAAQPEVRAFYRDFLATTPHDFAEEVARYMPDS